MSDEYIEAHFNGIKEHGSDIEARLDDSYCTIDQLKEDNHQIINGYEQTGEKISLIDVDYEETIRTIMD